MTGFPRLGLLILAFGLILRPSPTRAGNPVEDAMAATIRISDAQSSATAFVVRIPAESGDRHVLITAAHALEGMPGPTCQAILRRRTDSDRYERQEVAIPIRDGGRPRWRRHPELDVAALPIDWLAETAVQPFGLDQIADEATLRGRAIGVGREVVIPGFPGRLEGNSAGWPILRRGSIATHPIVPVAEARTFLVDARTFGGDSGAPAVVIDGSTARVVGLVIGFQRQTDMIKLPSEERTIHTPLGLAIVVQAEFLRRTIADLPH